jgi:hypothetical protein
MIKNFALICLVGGAVIIAGCVGKWEEEAKPRELKLSDFPEVFKENTLIIIGDNASEIEIWAVNEIAEYLENKTGNKPLIKRCSEVTEKDKKNYNLIVVGTPNSNPMLKEVYAMADVLVVNETFPGEGRGVLEILRNPWNENKAMLLVEGWDKWGVKESEVLLKHCNGVNLQCITTENFKKNLIDEISRFIKNYKVHIYQKYVSNWTILNSAKEIPYSRSLLAKHAKNPENYAKIVRPPAVYVNNDIYTITLYTWTEYGGVLLKWDVTVKSGCLDYVRAIVVDTFVGDFEPVPAEGRIIGPNDVIVANPEVKEVCIDVS